MHFRRRGSNVQIVKTQPGEKGKAASKPIGSANIRTGEISAQAAAVLTPEETQEVKTWIARQTAIEAQKRELDYRCLAETLSSVASWIRSADPALLRDHADEVRSGLVQVRRNLAVALGEAAAPDRQGGKRKKD